MTGWMGSMPVAVTLRRLFPMASFVGCADIPVVSATHHSGECRPGMLFAVLPGTRVHGSEFIADAVERGASALLVEKPVPGASVPQCVVANVRKAFAHLCSELAGNPSENLQLAAVTGTNGKTTVSWMVRSILVNGGSRTGMLGSIEYSDGSKSEAAGLTTPDSGVLFNWLAQMVNQEVSRAVMEVSSHALCQHRTAGAQFDAVAITNITQDHFDYHGDYNSYVSAKSMILEQLKPGALVALNVDDAGSLSLLDRANEVGQVVTFGVKEQADVRGRVVEESLSGSRFVIDVGDEKAEIWTPLIGLHNISNCLAAAAISSHLGASLDQIVDGLGALKSVPGRMELVSGDAPFSVFVDYAHTDDALRRSLNSLRRLTAGRLICVFGAGGDRDKSKRPLLGRAASEADAVIVTSDNPRSEEPRAIIEDVLPGLESVGVKYSVIVDRQEAIQRAMQIAKPGDCVLIAGKGHETEQVVGSERRVFDDRVVSKNALSKLLGTFNGSSKKVSA